MPGSARDDELQQHTEFAFTDDATVIAQIRLGNHAAYESLFHTYAPMLFRIAYGYVRSDDVAKDIVQDVMLSLWKNRERLEITGALQAYLQSATRKRALKVLVTETRAQRHEQAFAQEDATPGMGEQTALPDSQTETHELTVAIVEAVERLPERYRRVLMLRTEEQMTYPEIAALLGLPLKTVKTQARRGLERLQRTLRAYFPGL